MGLSIGKITGVDIGKNKDGTKDVRLLQVEMSGPDDVRTVELFTVSGEDSAPEVGDEVAIRVLGTSSNLIGESTKDTVAPSVNEGEKKLYSYASGTVKASIYLKADGSIEIQTLSAVNVVGDVIADFGVTNISLLNHYHQGNLGYPTGTPIQSGGGTTPSTPPSTNNDGDIIDGGGTNLSIHTHSQPADSNGDTEQNTSQPL
jgi:hypothetical protein